jgi:hypothetical protein
VKRLGKDPVIICLPADEDAQIEIAGAKADRELALGGSRYRPERSVVRRDV